VNSGYKNDKIPENVDYENRKNLNEEGHEKN